MVKTESDKKIEYLKKKEEYPDFRKYYQVSVTPLPEPVEEELHEDFRVLI